MRGVTDAADGHRHHRRRTRRFDCRGHAWPGGIETIIADPHEAYPEDFRCEKLDATQVAVLRKTGLAARVLAVEHNENPKPFVWKADPSRVLAAIERGKQALESVH